MLLKASRHFSEIAIDDEQQSSTNAVVAKELAEIAGLLETSVMPSWSAFLDSVEAECCLETQEAVRSLLTELHPEEIDNLEDQLVVDEAYRSKPDMPLAQFIELLGKHYGWSLQMDLAAPQQCAVFWYRSREKMEPRLGECELDPGEDRSLPMMVARDVQTCYAQAKALLEQRPKALVAELLLAAPELRSIVRRVQTMCEAHYGDIRVNLGAHDVQPMHLLRCKLSFFGVSKFDPRSRLWVRNTMFQGAPVISDIGSHYKDDWYFPCIDVATEISH